MNAMAAFHKHFPLLPRLALHLGSLAPLALLMLDALTGSLSANPIQEAEQRTGQAAIVLLLLSLACTPLNILFGFSRAVKHRRALGLYAFFYAGLHLFIFTVLDYGLAWGLLWDTILEKRYIFAGLAAFACLLALAVTSFRWWMKRMGKNWSRLHRLAYLAGGLAVLHYAWVVKGDVLGFSGDVVRPIVYGVVLALLLAARVPPLRRAIVRLRRQVGQSKTQKGKLASLSTFKIQE